MSFDSRLARPRSALTAILLVLVAAVWLAPAAAGNRVGAPTPTKASGFATGPMTRRSMRSTYG